MDGNGNGGKELMVLSMRGGMSGLGWSVGRIGAAMDGIEELQEPGRTSLAPKDVWACLRLDLWDPRKKRMVSRGD